MTAGGEVQTCRASLPGAQRKPPAATSRPVYIRRIARVSALGLSAPAAARAFWTGAQPARWRELPDARYPWFGLPLEETEWSQRFYRAIDAIRRELEIDLAGLPLFLGSSSLQIGAFEARARATQNAALPHDPASIGAEISALLGARTDAWLFSTGCSSGLAALEAAFLMIAQGRIDKALALGFEFANETTLAGFASLALLAPDEEADGLILGEAVGALLLSADPGEGPAWRIDACRLGIDAYSPTAPTPDGSVIAANLAAALQDAGLVAADIDLVKSHQGRVTATDAAEAAALARIFGCRRPPEITCKRRIGHTLGASGPAELTLLLALLATPESIERYGQPQRLLFNLVGFGGSIAALVLASTSEEARGIEKRAGVLPPKAAAASLALSPPVCCSLSAEALVARAKAHSAVSLRRAGALTRMLMVGAATCLAGQPARPTLVLLGSRVGMNAAALRLIHEVALAREAPLPFDFLATQPILAAIPAQQTFPCIENLLYLPWGSDTELHRQQMRRLAAAWLQSGRCEQVLCGEVEPTADGFQGRWQVGYRGSRVGYQESGIREPLIESLRAETLLSGQ
jgi:3-oxoacyl-[acyl-carrier-protein] synthase-1